MEHGLKLRGGFNFYCHWPLKWFVKQWEENFHVSRPVLPQIFVFSPLTQLLVYFFVLQTPGIASQFETFSINLSILSADVGYPPVSTQFIFDPVTSPRIKVTFDPPFDWPVINQFKHITNKYICEISKANHRWNPKVVNLLDSNLHKIFPNMLVPQHNRFRNLPSITNNNFVH